MKADRRWYNDGRAEREGREWMDWLWSRPTLQFLVYADRIEEDRKALERWEAATPPAAQMNSVGHRLRYARQARGYTPAIVARHCGAPGYHIGMTKGQVVSWESGKVGIPIDAVVLLAWAYEAPIEWVLNGGEPPMPPRKRVRDYTPTEQVYRFLRDPAWKRLKARLREKPEFRELMKGVELAISAQPLAISSASLPAKSDA